MPSKKLFELQAEACKALAHPLRIEVIEILKDGELCFSDILEKTGGLKSNLSQHMSMMVSCGILKIRKDSRCNYFSLTSSKVAKACAIMREVLADNLKKNQEILRSL